MFGFGLSLFLFLSVTAVLNPAGLRGSGSVPGLREYSVDSQDTVRCVQHKYELTRTWWGKNGRK